MPKHKFRINEKEKKKNGKRRALTSDQITKAKMERTPCTCSQQLYNGICREEIILGGGRNRCDFALMVRMKPWMLIKAVANAVSI